MSEPEPIQDVIADVMITFFDAVRDDPEMTDEQKIYWLHVTAKDYFEKLETLEPQLTAALAEVEAMKAEHVILAAMMDEARVEIERLRQRVASPLRYPTTEVESHDH